MTAIGMVLGAYKGVNAIDEKWLESLEQYNYFEGLLNTLPLLNVLSSKIKIN